MLPTATKAVDIKGPSINTRASLLKSAEVSSLFFFFNISWFQNQNLEHFSKTSFPYAV